jgi:hypothetical protein
MSLPLESEFKFVGRGSNITIVLAKHDYSYLGKERKFARICESLKPDNHLTFLYRYGSSGIPEEPDA